MVNIDWLLWTVGAKEDWDRYAKIIGSNAWSWKNVQRLLRKIERFVAPTKPSMVSMAVSCMILVQAHTYADEPLQPIRAFKFRNGVRHLA